MVTITGLTKQQVELLDTMWAIDSVEEYSLWKSRQPKKIRAMVSVLEEMVILAELDDVQDTSDAEEVLRKYI